jgi:hypothetical protein
VSHPASIAFISERLLLLHSYMQSQLFRFLIPVSAWCFCANALGSEAHPGEKIYRDKCAKCHGVAGEGSEDQYPEPLVGDRSIQQLASLIATTMPEDKPGSCVGEEAEKVSAYIFEAFYSPAAQARNNPVRIELSRLTVRQYRHAITDLIGSFREPMGTPGEPGLSGEYYKSRRSRSSDRVLKRVDPQINFQFGESSPLPEVEPREFSMEWEGAVLAPDTGEYEFILQTENSARVWVNDLQQPLIDAYVKSGTDTEYRQAIRLLGGRLYPLRIEYSKAQQGVDQSKEEKEKKPIGKASIVLMWKLPQRVPEVIPQRYLSSRLVPGSFVLQTPFPPDDRSVGYERGTSVSKAWDEATTDAAIEVASYISSQFEKLSKIDDRDSDRANKAREFCRQFAERAFRRPLTDEEKELFIERHFNEVKDVDSAVKRVILLVLKSPRFLYREPTGRDVDAYDIASRMSFGLWDSLPDPELLKAAAAGELATREQRTSQAERMVGDLRTRAKVREFLLQWLKVDQVPDVLKDSERFPEFNVETASDLRTSLDLFLEDVVWSDSSDFRQFLLSDSLFLNGRLSKFYGAELPENAPFQKVQLQPEARAGVLSHPYLMASFAYTSTSSPIHRGVFIARSLLGRSLRPPPDAVTPLPPELHADLTTRERIILQTQSESCQTCHSMINPLGFTLEHFDAVGRYRKEEKGRPVDASGLYQTRSGEMAKFQGVRELAAFLAASDETHSTFVEQLFHYLVKQPIRAFGSEGQPQLQQYFAKNDFNIRKLLVEMMVVSAAKD